jgi:Ni/Fe-hydrogenase subunit HybB-like protein
VISRLRRIFWRLVALAILAAGAHATWVRFTGGLGAATNLSDRFPWGLWIGFDILCGVGLAAGGFAVTTAVYILHLERLRPIVRPAVLTAFLGYLLVVLALGLFLFLRFWDLARLGALPAAWRFSGAGSLEAGMFWLETALLAVPVLLVLPERVRSNPQALFASSAMVVGGFLVNRLNVSTTGLAASSGAGYFPSWMEISVTLMIVVIGLWVFSMAVRHLPVFQPAAPEMAER